MPTTRPVWDRALSSYILVFDDDWTVRVPGSAGSESPLPLAAGTDRKVVNRYNPNKQRRNTWKHSLRKNSQKVCFTSLVTIFSKDFRGKLFV